MVDGDGGWVNPVGQLDHAGSSNDKGRGRELAVGVRTASTRPETLTLASTHFAQLALFTGTLAWIVVGDL